MNHDILQKALQEVQKWFDITGVIPGTIIEILVFVIILIAL
jgi:hypothetical protein